MSTTLTRATSTVVPKAFVAVGVALAINAVAFGSQLFFNSASYSEIAATSTHLIHYVVWTAAFIALGQLVPRLWEARDGSRVPGGVLAMAGAGFSLDACARFVQAFVNPYLEKHVPSLLDATPNSILLVPLLVAGFAAMIGGAALGIMAWRRGLIGVPPMVLLVVGSIAIPVLGPLSNALLGAGLVWLGFRGIAARAA